MPTRFSLLKLWREGLWEYSYFLRALFVVGRVLELAFIIVRYLFIRAPALIVWTNTPMLSRVTSPWPHLQDVFARSGRAVMVVGEPLVGTGTSDSVFVDLASSMQNELQLTDKERALLAKLSGNKASGPSQYADEELGNMSDLLLDHKADVVRYWKGLTETPTAVERRTGGGWLKATVGAIVRGLLTEMGPTFLKLAQIMSMRAECPPFLREELQQVQDKVAPARYAEVRRVVEKEILKPYDYLLGRSLDDYFEWMDELPIASASLSQVHAAKLRDGREVALKIQRPYLDAILTVDKLIIVDIVVNQVLNRVLAAAKYFDLTIFTASFKRSLALETDFVLESRTQRRFYDLVNDNPVYHRTEFIPEPYFEYCTDKLLVMELVKNYVRIDRLTDITAEAVIYGALAYEIPEYPPEHSPVVFWATASLWGDMILKWGFIHGDPHLGNLYVMMPSEDLPTARVFLCDYGMVEEFPPEGLKWATDLFQSLLWYRSADKLSELFLRFMTMSHKELRLLGAGSDQFKLAEEAQGHTDALRELIRVEADKWIERRLPMEGDVITFRLKRHGTGMLVQELIYLLVGLDLSKAGLPQGVKLTLPDWIWLLVKSLGYLETLGVTMWGGYDASDMFMPHVVTGLKEDILDGLEDTNVDNVKEYIDELTEPLNRPGMMAELSRFGR